MADTASSSVVSKPLFAVSDNERTLIGIRDATIGWLDMNLQGEALFEAFLEDMHPSVLYTKAFISSLMIHGKLRDLLLNRGVAVRKARGFSMLNALIELYSEDQDRKLAKALVTPLTFSARAAVAVGSSGARNTRTVAPRQSDGNGHRVASK